MTVFQLKLLAIFLMIIDHIGAYLLPDLVWLRVVGRLSFPLFAWLIANGYRHTSNVYRYIGRLLIFALISQLPFVLINGTISSPLFSLNIFFTLWIGLVTILLLDRSRSWLGKLAWICLGALMGWILPVDYGMAGVLSIIAFHLSFNRTKLMFSLQLAIFGTFFSLPLLLEVAANPNLVIHPVRLWQPLAAISVWLISQYNGQKGRALQLWFYLFYPLHLLLLWWLRQIG